MSKETIEVGTMYRGTGGVGVRVRVEEIVDKRARCTLVRSGVEKWISLATLRSAYKREDASSLGRRFYDEYFGSINTASEAARAKEILASAEKWAREFLVEYDQDDGNRGVIPKIDRSEIALLCVALTYRSERACRCSGGFVCTPCLDRGVGRLAAVREYVDGRIVNATGDTRAALEDIDHLLRDEAVPSTVTGRRCWRLVAHENGSDEKACGVLLPCPFHDAPDQRGEFDDLVEAVIEYRRVWESDDEADHADVAMDAMFDALDKALGQVGEESA